jgi:hypothetical protein
VRRAGRIYGGSADARSATGTATTHPLASEPSTWAVSEPVYWVLQVIGGIGGGYGHVGARSGAVRRVIGGLLFGAFILIAHEISGMRHRSGAMARDVLAVVRRWCRVRRGRR